MSMFKKNHSLRIVNFLVALSAAVVVMAQLAAFAGGFTNTWKDDFSGYTSKYYVDEENFGSWFVQFGGWGTVGIESNSKNDWLHLSPKAAKSADITHSALATTHSFKTPLQFQSKITTVKQLRIGSTPNPWEVAWVVWDYTDNEHFYYFIPKPNGWELGKRDPSYDGGQRFLATGNKKFPIGKAYVVKVLQDSSNKISVWVNNKKITSFTDTENPYTSGKVGIYSEDAHVHFDDVVASY